VKGRRGPPELDQPSIEADFWNRLTTCYVVCIEAFLEHHPEE
jgi:hypothetical protein